MEKRCWDCGEPKALTDFYKCSSSLDGRQSRCRRCTRRANSANYHANPEASHTRVTNWRSEHADEVNERNRKRRPQIRMAVAKYIYGICKEDLIDLHKVQRDKCAICGSSPTNERLSIDHNHLTGAVRGLLCKRCNLGLGAYRDNPELLRRAAFYIESRSEYDARKTDVA